MLLMDRENLFKPGWSHVLSTTNDLLELEELRIRVGAPRRAFHLSDGRPHLDLKLEPRDRALQDPAVTVVETSRELILWWRASQAASAKRDAPHPAGQ